MPQTLLKTLTEATGLSRRSAFDAIRRGRVTEGGLTVLHPSGVYSGGRLLLDGAPVGRGGPKVYLVMNKPPGIITSASDDLGRRTVLDLVPPDLDAPGLHSVGRLDRDTSGLLLLTNDGDLTYRLTHPSHEVEKEYWLASSPPLGRAQVEELGRGVEIDGRMRAPLKMAALAAAGRFQLAVVIKEGRNRQVRRMVEAVGGRVVALRRVREGPLSLQGLPEGAVRRLLPAEVAGLVRA
jgi:23S rRNA pseudouridine2605 synthase